MMVRYLWAFVIGIFVTSIMALSIDEKFNSSLPQNENGHAQSELTLSELLAAMIKHEYGMKHLGTDGVLRSFAPNGTVLDYVKLNSTQVQQMIDRYSRDDYLTEAFDGVDGHNVIDQEQLMNPGEHILPSDFKNWTKDALASLNNIASTNPKSTFHTEEMDEQEAFATNAPTSKNATTNPVQPRIVEGGFRPPTIPMLWSSSAHAMGVIFMFYAT